MIKLAWNQIAGGTSEGTEEGIVLNASRRQFLAGVGTIGLTAFASSRLATADSPLKVGVVYSSPVGEIGWTKTHSLAVQALKDTLGDAVSIATVENIYSPQDAERVFRELASDGNQLIFGTTFAHGTALQKVAPLFPKTTFETCAGVVQLANVGIFDAKYYEGTFIAGAAAAHVSKTGKIGYIAGFPIPLTISTANAFLLGARRINPDVTCSVIFLNSWFDPGKEKEAANTLVSQGCDVLTAMSDTPVTVRTAGERGIWSVGVSTDLSKFASGKQLTSWMFDWSSDYISPAKAVIAGTWKPQDRWDGLAAGVVKMAPYNEALSAETRDKLRQLEADVGSKKVHPFAGELKDQDGKVKAASGTTLSDADIRSMNWFVSGITGKLS
jgi:basic membrane protein A and related proteins